MPPTSDLSSRTTIVVGASRGPGRGIATALAHAGAPVIAVARARVLTEAARTRTSPRRSAIERARLLEEGGNPPQRHDRWISARGRISTGNRGEQARELTRKRTQ